MRAFIIISIMLVIIPGSLLARLDNSDYFPWQNPYQPHPSFKGEVSDRPADWWIVAWAGIGLLRDLCISNTLQGGIFGRPPDWQYYDGTFPWGALDRSLWGLNGEYPAGSGQYYIWASGIWVGALYPIIEDGDTIWQPRVSKGCYYSDLGAMSVPEAEDLAGKDFSGLGLYFSDMRIPKGYGYEGEGDYLFVQPGMSQASYQALWPFADTSINVRRPPGTEVDPSRGDIVAMQETYAVAGDWIPPDDATVLWIRDAGPYDVHGLGIRIEQRTYSWNYEYNDDYVYFSYKIRNMNDFPLKNVYVGYFMDNDVGSENSEPQGAWDDMIGYNRELNLGYTYDSDAQEPGWKTPAGYVGCVMVETPGDIGMTGFLTWLHGDIIDDDATDSIKYQMMTDTSFMTYTSPMDVRQLSVSGPYPVLMPGEEISFTVAVVVGLTYEELCEHAQYAIKQFNTGYMGFAPPPSPQVVVVPGECKAYISWDDRAEHYVCPMTGLKTFEGYRVYRSLTGLPEDWELIAEYDLPDTRTPDTVIITHTAGVSTATARFVRFLRTHTGDVVTPAGSYKVRFITNNDIIIAKVTDGELTFYEYNPTPSIGDGFAIIRDTIRLRTYDTYPGYISGAWILIDSMIFTIRDGEFTPGVSNPVSPQAGEEFIIDVYRSEEIGPQTGLRHYFIDEGLTPGITYYYTVTSYSRPLPTYGVGSLESGKTGKTYWVIPYAKLAADYEQARGDIEHTTGICSYTGDVIITNPGIVPACTLTIKFTGTDGPDYAQIWQSDSLLYDSIELTKMDPYYLELFKELQGYILEFIFIENNTPDSEYVIDSSTSYWREGDSNYEIRYTSQREFTPYDYEIRFTDTVCYGYHDFPAYLYIWNVTLDTFTEFWLRDLDHDTIWEPGEYLRIFSPDGQLMGYFTLHEPTTGEPHPPEPGDIFYVKTLRKLTTDDEFRIVTYPYRPKPDYSLDSVYVVPNPYYIRAPWDATRYEHKVWFFGLPSRCKIRIFNTAGLLIREIDYEAEAPEAGATYWDMLTNEGQEVVSGLYIYQIVTPDGIEKIGKLAIIR